MFPIAEYNGEMVGFWMGLPDYNIALKHINGKLNWLGILKFLWYRREINQGRVIAICSLPEYRRKMVPLALIYLGMMGGIKRVNHTNEQNFPGFTKTTSPPANSLRHPVGESTRPIGFMRRTWRGLNWAMGHRQWAIGKRF